MRKQPTLHSVLAFFEREIPKKTKSWLEDVCTPKELTRTTFFKAAYWAILVANMNVDTAQIWRDKAKECGFPFDWRKLGDWNDGDGQFDAWCKRMAKKLANPKEDLHGLFRARWWGIWDVGWRLAQFGRGAGSGAAFRKHYFNGKKYGDELTEENFHRLLEIKQTEGALYQIGEVSIHFILRNLGGNFLKPDTWIKAFAEWYGCTSVEQLASALMSGGIHRGKFDAYCWKYCVAHIGQASNLPRHFNQLFRS